MRRRRAAGAGSVGLLAAVLVSLSASLAAAAAPAPRLGPPRPFALERVEVRALAAAATGVSYKLYVSLPHSYDGDVVTAHATLSRRDHYPVVYLLDADYSFLLARNITDHLAERADLPEVILVGIGYDGPRAYRRHRTRDYTPTFVPDGGYGPELQRYSGGGPKFLEFLAAELLPAVEEAYRVTPGDRTIVGHSYGGLFASWALFERPALFGRAVAVSPSLWYDDRLVLRREQTYAADHRRLPGRVYFGVGAREINSSRSMVADLAAFARQLRARGYEGLELQVAVLDDETHNSVFPRALSNGLRFVFAAR
ncbi:MAG: alpha/beta hydrolase-fold protein [Acidobacteriota bacterium]|nr:alpha/beta hydrolase-fold protein [Acidobacteriota bacterium]